MEHEQDKDCDLVVLGKHGQSTAEDLLLGSVSKHVLAEGSTDVLVSTARAA
ncbi:MAG TPA: universal stress protein [Rubrivivax sp.]|nr:universal stress protein [Rubrivivax sp.]